MKRISLIILFAAGISFAANAQESKDAKAAQPAPAAGA